MSIGYEDQNGRYNPPDASELEETMAEILKRPWLQDNFIEWIAVDALIYAELDSYRRGIRDGTALGITNWAYILGETELQRIFAQLEIGFAKLFFLYVAPLATAGVLFYFGHPDWALAAIGWFVLVVLLRLVSLPSRISGRREKRKRIDETLGLYKSMINVYFYCDLPIINPSLLQSQLRSAVEEGVRFRPVVHSLVDRWVERDRNAFIPEIDS